MVMNRHGSLPLLVLGQAGGSGWLVLGKHHSGWTDDAFIELVKLTKTVS